MIWARIATAVAFLLAGSIALSIGQHFKIKALEERQLLLLTQISLLQAEIDASNRRITALKKDRARNEEIDAIPDHGLRLRIHPGWMQSE